MAAPATEEEEGREAASDLTPRGAVGELIFLRLGGRGAAEEGGQKASSSEDGEEGEESEVGDCFPRRRLRRVTDFDGGSLRGFRGRGLLD